MYASNIREIQDSGLIVAGLCGPIFPKNERF
jgi:hypothetical protein